MVDRVPLKGTVPYLFAVRAEPLMEWYQRVFGFEPHSQWSDDDGVVQNADMRVGDTEVWIDGGNDGYWDSRGGRADQWIGVWVDDPDAMYAQVRAAGVACDPPVDEPYGVRMLKVTDPEGYQWGFLCRIDEVPFPPDPT
ncbi:MAG: VOC family protein [Acidimicrobiia bacterium]|nr:VOC family protein [Acidimicrobiia bacterium]